MRLLTPDQLALAKSRAPVPAAPKAAKTRPVRTFQKAVNLWGRATQLPDDVEVQKAVSRDMLAANLRTQGITPPFQDSGCPARFLVGPGDFCDEAFEYHVSLAAEFAVGRAGTARPVSPQLLPYLLGGVPMATVERAALRAVALYGDLEDVGCALLDSLCHVGFGANFPHSHVDTVYPDGMQRNPDERFQAYKHRLEALGKHKEAAPLTKGFSVRQDYLYRLPDNGMSFAQMLMDSPPYAATMRRRVTRHKREVIKDVYLLLQKEQEEMPALAHATLVERCGGEFDYRLKTEITDQMFKDAVHRVFEAPWKTLDLTGDLKEDLVVLLARRLIYRLMGGARNSLEPMRMRADTLVGISLITGISIAQWVAFAVEDGERRGESFLDSSTIEEAVEIIECTELFTHFTCQDELERLRLRLQALEPYHCEWSQRLRKPKRPFWSTRHVPYYLKSSTTVRDGEDEYVSDLYRYQPEKIGKE